MAKLSYEDILNNEQILMNGEDAVITKQVQINERKAKNGRTIHDSFDFNFKPLTQEILVNMDSDFIKKVSSVDKKDLKDKNMDKIFEKIGLNEMVNAVNELLSKLWITDLKTDRKPSLQELANMKLDFKIKLFTIILEESGFTNQNLQAFMKEP